MRCRERLAGKHRFTVVESPVTLQSQLLILCARIGYSPPFPF
jgi:hypothetical protein